MSKTNQKSKLIFQLTREMHECMICCAKIRRKHSTWSCPVCYNVFHLECIKKWATSSVGENEGWRCPGCQSYTSEIPYIYTCFCGKQVNPSHHHSSLPHSCGDTCGRIGNGGPGCNHGCPDRCHPGRCNPCCAQVRRPCACGKQSVNMTCSSTKVLLCGSTCDKPLNCGVHFCTRNCHEEPCNPCEVVRTLICYCGKDSKYVICSVETRNQHWYGCDQKCDRVLDCKKHKCEEICHAICNPCKLSPSQVRMCPCGQTPIDIACKRSGLPLRTSCLDPIPTCWKSCNKKLTCGSAQEPHRCQNTCHLEAQCPTCPSSTVVKCRCGNKDSQVLCKELGTIGEILCAKKCSKKRSCGKHKCNTQCCIDRDHICPIVCDRPLSCGKHQCELLCHFGHCSPCRIVSFDELTCECGNAVIYPPVPCGTRLPECGLRCTRTHDCEHEVHHTCHGEPECPPCYVLTSKWCHGGHLLRQNILCHVKEVSCGLPCGKLLKCSIHKCPKKCHPRECMREDEVCKLPCIVQRKTCGHNCNAVCHAGPCPETKCKVVAEVTCMCSRIKDTMVCWKRESEYEKLFQNLLTQKLEQLKLENVSRGGESNGIGPGTSIDAEQLKTDFESIRSRSQLLKCDKECARIERNKKLATALQLENPDVSTQFGVPNYSDYMKKMAQKNPRFVEMVHEKLAALVMKAKEMKTNRQKNLTYQFDGLNRDKRQLIYEYCEHFGCLYNSMDEGEAGLKSAIITASKDKCWLPSVSLVDAVFQQTVRAERKTAYADVELSQSNKSQILGPASNFRRLDSSKPK